MTCCRFVELLADRLGFPPERVAALVAETEGDRRLGAALQAAAAAPAALDLAHVREIATLLWANGTTDPEARAFFAQLGYRRADVDRVVGELYRRFT